MKPTNGDKWRKWSKTKPYWERESEKEPVSNSQKEQK